MPITETNAKLWFTTEAEKQAYDDRMLANIELKSLDFDDENFSPVFNRKTQEVFLEPGEKFKNDFNKIIRPMRNHDFESYIDKYVLIKPNHTYYRSWTIEKFFGGLLGGYFIMREIPFRNFWARCFVMWAYAAKILDHMKSPIPYQGYPVGDIVMAADRWAFWDIRCYDNAWRAIKFIEIPSAMNKVSEAKTWNGRQPGHILPANYYYFPHYITSFTRKEKEAPWDGTMNMPIYRLADPKSKDSYMMHYN